MYDMNKAKLFRPWTRDGVVAEETTDLQQPATIDTTISNNIMDRQVNHGVTRQCGAYTYAMCKDSDSESSSESSATSEIGSREPIRPADHYHNNELDMRQSSSSSSSEYFPSNGHMVQILTNQSEAYAADANAAHAAAAAAASFEAAFNRAQQQLKYGLPGLHLGIYANGVEEAVQYLHQEDVAARRMKKLRPKKFKCNYDLCTAEFSNNGQLRGHERIHTGERPFKCDVEGCGKDFTRNEELTRHKKIHTGLRPHMCALCGKSFGRKDHLTKHRRTHENRAAYHIPPVAFAPYAQALTQSPLISYMYY